MPGLTQAIERNLGAMVIITSYGWPRFGRDRIGDFLTKQRDVCAFLYNQTVQLMNAGLNYVVIGESAPAHALALLARCSDQLAR